MGSKTTKLLLLDSLLQEKSKWETLLDTVAARETCSRVASRSLGWSTYPPTSRCTRLETLLTSRDAVLSRRVCPTRPTTARLDVPSTSPSAPCVLVARSCPRGSTCAWSISSTASAGRTSWTECTP